MTKSFSVLAIAAAALCTSAIMVSPAAYAAEAANQGGNQGGNQALVSWRGLDLRTDAGRHMLAKRTEIAARKVCPDQLITGSRLPDTEVEVCRVAVRAKVAQRVSADQHLAVRN